MLLSTPHHRCHGDPSLPRRPQRTLMDTMRLLHTPTTTTVSSSNATDRRCFRRPRAQRSVILLSSPKVNRIESKFLHLTKHDYCSFFGSSFWPKSFRNVSFEATKTETSAISIDLWLDNKDNERLSTEQRQEYNVKEGDVMQAETIGLMSNESSPISSDNGNDGFKSMLSGNDTDYVDNPEEPTEVPGEKPLMLKSGSDLNTVWTSEIRGSGDISDRTTGFWKIVQNDVKFLRNKIKWFREDALPLFSENMEQIVTMRVWEDSSTVKNFETKPAQSPHYPGLSGLDLVAADAKVLKSYYDSAVDWLMTWSIPLQPIYDPDTIAAYFNRRPHVLLFRLVQVYVVFGSAFIQLEIEKFLRSSNLNLGNEEFAQKRGAELLKDALTKLGPTFIKVGQSLSTRSDLIGAEAAKVLSELQDNLPPFPTKKAISIIEAEIGRPLSSVFSYLSDVPVAAASFGQVYKGKTIDGQEVAVKVQRPNLLHSIALDTYILRMGLAAIRKIAKRRSDLRLYADEIGQGLFGELDYTREAANSIEFKEAHSKLSFLEVPRPFLALSTRKVLTMEWINGERPTDMFMIMRMPNPDGDVTLREQQMSAKQRLFSMVNKGIEASLVQLLETGILHADPHPGNMLYSKDGQLIFLDFGLLCRMEKHHQFAMLGAVVHIVNADWENFVQDLAQLDVLPSYVDRRAVTLELQEELADAVPQEGIPDIKFSKVLGKVLTIALRNQFKMPPYFILVLRSIASLEGLALAVDPDFKVFAASYPYVLQRLLVDNSPPLRKILFSLILNKNKQIRWDRVTSFVALARQHIMKKLALQAGKEVESVTVPNFENAKTTSPELLNLVVNVLLSERGSAFRQLVLEADTYDLAKAFNSSKAASIRKSVAMKIADALYQHGRAYIKDHTRIDLKAPELSDVTTSAQSAKSVCDKALAEDMKAITDCSDTVDISLLKNTHMQVLLQTLVSRLQKRPFLLLQTSWKFLTVLSYALFVAAHKLVIAACFKYLESRQRSSPKAAAQLIMA